MLLLIAASAGRRPTLVVGAGPPSAVADSLCGQLSSPPTLGLCFARRGLGGAAVRDLLERRLPPTLRLIGACTHQLQAIPSAGGGALYEPAAAGGAADDDGDDDDDLSLLLGSFPDATTAVFQLAPPELGQIARLVEGSDGGGGGGAVRTRMINDAGASSARARATVVTQSGPRHATVGGAHRRHSRQQLLREARPS